MNDLNCVKLKQIMKLPDIVKKNNQNYKLKCGKIFNFGKYLLSIIF